MPSISFKRMIQSLITIIFLSLLGMILMLTLFQHKLIYYPQPYNKSYEKYRPTGTIELAYTTGEGNQVAFFVPPQNQTSMKIWVIFGGNAMLALDWTDFLSGFPDEQTGFLLMDYPGYGHCEGSASPATILESTEQAVVKLAEYLEMSVSELEPHLRVLGHSLGSGPALQFAVKHPIQQIVLSSTFTSMKDMAARIVGPWISYLLLHRFDNRARLSELSQRKPPPKITLFHGDRDTIIPVAMGRELAQLFPQMIQYHEIQDGMHNTLLFSEQSQFHKAMMETSLSEQ